MNTTEVKEEKKQEKAAAEKPAAAEVKSDVKSGCGCCGGRREKK